MSRNYDNWERLVRVVLRREHDRQLALCDSSDTCSIDSSSSSSTYQFQFHYDLVAPPENIRSIPSDYSDLVLNHWVWRTMLPSGEQEILYKSASMSFSLDRVTGKNCFLMGAMSLLFSMENWDLKPHEKSRFSEAVAPKSCSQDLDIRGLISMQMLSPKTLYAGYLVFQLETNERCLAHSTIEISVRGENEEYSEVQKHVIHFQLCRDRPDGWKEIRLGEFYVHEGLKAEIDAWLVYSSVSLPKDIVIEGIEFRPSKSPSQLLTKETPMDGWRFNEGR